MYVIAEVIPETFDAWLETFQTFSDALREHEVIPLSSTMADRTRTLLLHRSHPR